MLLILKLPIISIEALWMWCTIVIVYHPFRVSIAIFMKLLFITSIQLSVKFQCKTCWWRLVGIGQVCVSDFFKSWLDPYSLVLKNHSHFAINPETTNHFNSGTVSMWCMYYRYCVSPGQSLDCNIYETTFLNSNAGPLKLQCKTGWWRLVSIGQVRV